MGRLKLSSPFRRFFARLSRSIGSGRRRYDDRCLTCPRLTRWSAARLSRRLPVVFQPSAFFTYRAAEGLRPCGLGPSKRFRLLDDVSIARGGMLCQQKSCDFLTNYADCMRLYEWLYGMYETGSGFWLRSKCLLGKELARRWARKYPTIMELWTGGA